MNKMSFVHLLLLGVGVEPTKDDHRGGFVGTFPPRPAAALPVPPPVVPPTPPIAPILDKNIKSVQ